MEIISEIELLTGQNGDVAEATPPRNESNSITCAKLLKGIDKSYDKGLKLLEASEYRNKMATWGIYMRNPSFDRPTANQSR